MRYPVVPGPLMALGVAVAWLLAMPSALADEQPGARDLPLEELRTLSEVFSRVKGDYVEDVSDKELLENAIRGMLQGLDPHSAYLSADDFAELQEGTSGEFGGLGLEVDVDDGFIRVVAPIDDTPAARAGIRAGDLIIRLDDRSTRGMNLNEAVSLMRGEPGTDITLTITREGQDEPLEVTLTRDVVQVVSVRSRMLEDGYGYLRISQFQNRTAANLKDQLAALNEAADGSLDGLVLDLRNNPGGVLQAAVAVADAFLEEGRIVYTEGRLDQAQMEFDASGEDLAHGAPIVVLINEGSASGSEIVAGALQDHRRAVVMGTRSFGKGSVQSVLPLNSGAAIKLTTARYYTPDGRSIQAEGIEPDVILDRVQVRLREDSEPRRLTERDLQRHLDGDQLPRLEDADEQRARAVDDYAVFEALNLLKGLRILGQRR
ncbi:S41 family peptidase [Methylonatrum kenyense]|uniref:S41 family peptidase n=1 Tax=Methylonatrum kenyense TaxID=455253 RepID=UPI0020BFE832|nr:S41 family peptidase [Methylonatrum kenyense]MCK8515279.1 S41 family peptidase [Methylonatrum kenyense]